jgi:hypothetical protein
VDESSDGGATEASAADFPPAQDGAASGPDLRSDAGGGTAVADAGKCSALQLKIDTLETCALSISPGFTVDGEGFITVSGEKKGIVALTRAGAGHVVAWCDATTLGKLLAAFDARAYLGKTKTARVASIGDTHLCKEGVPGWPLPSYLSYQGQELPEKYRGNAAQLAADWDAIVFCGFRIPWSYDATQELDAFVTKYGKGLLAVMDYQGAGVVTKADFGDMNKVTAAFGISFDPLDLPGGNATLDAKLDCVPDLPPPPR